MCLTSHYGQTFSDCNKACFVNFHLKACPYPMLIRLNFSYILCRRQLPEREHSFTTWNPPVTPPTLTLKVEQVQLSYDIMTVVTAHMHHRLWYVKILGY